MIGFVTDENGNVSIDNINEVKDSIVISTVGYQRKVIYAGDIAGKKKLLVILDKLTITLPEVKIGNRKNVNIYGSTDKKEGYSYLTNFTSSSLQVSYLFNEYSVRSYLDEFSIFIANKSDNRIPFRIRMYSNDNGTPGNEIINKNVIITKYSPGKWNVFELDSLDLLTPDGGFFIGIEWLVTNSLKNYRLAIGQTDALKTERTFVRWGNANWKKFTPTSPIKKNPTNIMIQVKLSTF